MKKGSRIIFEGKTYTVWKKEGKAIYFYDPDAKYPETTMQATSINKVRKAGNNG